MIISPDYPDVGCCLFRLIVAVHNVRHWRNAGGTLGGVKGSGEEGRFERLFHFCLISQLSHCDVTTVLAPLISDIGVAARFCCCGRSTEDESSRLKYHFTHWVDIAISLFTSAMRTRHIDGTLSGQRQQSLLIGCGLGTASQSAYSVSSSAERANSIGDSLKVPSLHLPKTSISQCYRLHRIT